MDHLDRPARAAELAAKGVPFVRIADQLGYTSDRQARRSVEQYLAGLRRLTGNPDKLISRYSDWLFELRQQSRAAYQVAASKGDSLAMSAATRVGVAVATRTAAFYGIDARTEQDRASTAEAISFLAEVVARTTPRVIEAVPVTETETS